ncbi:MAG TPA: malto-oligosyltrehalose synthase [Longimicrobium sp.]
MQFNAHFTFADAMALVPYLAGLGIGDLYASPYLQARPGSLHGYDIVDHGSLNREIGTEAELAELSAALAGHGMGQVLDIVPNHMGIAGGANHWWNDLLEHGPSSPWAAYFDIDWYPRKPELHGKVLLPLLGDQYGKVLDRGELVLVYLDGRFFLDYHETRLPVAPAPTAAVLRLAGEELDGVLEKTDPTRMELESIATALQRLPPRRLTDEASVDERRRERTISQRRLRALEEASPEVRTALAAAVRAFNGVVGEPASFDRLDALLDDQPYRLAFWRVAAEEINYRRFFDINELAGLRPEVPRVFDDTHRLVLRLVGEGKVTGLRVDHPDGLYDPGGYLGRLAAQASAAAEGGPFHLLIEKILTGEETIPDDWPVSGTVGYEFLNRVNGLFVRGENAGAMDAVYHGFAGPQPRFADLAYSRKRLILRISLVSELTVLAAQLDRISETSRRTRDFTYGSLLDALRELVACFPVYRTYIDAEAGHVSEADRRTVERAVRAAKRRNRATSEEIFDFLRDILLLRWPAPLDADARAGFRRFVMKFQQLTGPVMAKGVEDTTFYVYNRLVSLNEVGGEPDRFGVTAAELHAFLAERAGRWPRAMSAGSTHDTKRSEDVRARINVLSEIPDLWGERASAWHRENARHLRSEDGHPVPDPNDEYLFYQTLVGAWPLEPLDAPGREAFIGRMQAYMAKATREAKVHTSWINPDPVYDRGLAEFIAAVLRPTPDGGFLDDFLAFQETVAELGMVNSLAQTLLRLTAPGVPDIYQGQELWDFSLVDPDNRRPVDFSLRRRLLEGLARAESGGDPETLSRMLVEGWKDGRIKMQVVRTALAVRNRLPAVFGGAYVPLEADGPAAEHVMAFARVAEGGAVITVVPRLVATLTRGRGFGIPLPSDWTGTRLVLPEGLAGRYRDAFTGNVRVSDAAARTIAAGQVLGGFPVALLERV